MNEYFDEQSKTWDQHKDRVDRAQEIARKMKIILHVSKDMSALEFGCGTGLLGFNLVGEVRELTFADTSSGMIGEVEEKIRKNGIMNARTLNLSKDHISGKYDLIFSLMALHHIEDFRSQVSLLIDSLNDGGMICLCDLDREDGSFHMEETVPHNGFDRDEIIGIYREKNLDLVDASTGYVNRKMVGSREKEFPMFMITGKKNDRQGDDHVKTGAAGTCEP
jgi:cyclopropane fatty-acyl-phospholipid synthase-like methyltransferase